MAIARTTIMASEKLMKRVTEHVNAKEESITEFMNRAILNQLEKEGDFEIRDLTERELADGVKNY